MADEIFCITCGDYLDNSQEDTGDWNAFGHTDSAHFPNWSDTPSEELDIMTSLADYGTLPTYLR